MSGIRDTATVTLNVNGAQAKQMMADLEQKVEAAKKKVADLKAKMADPKEVEAAKKQLNSLNNQLNEMRSATEGVQDALSNLDKATPRELERSIRTLNRQLKDMRPGSDVWDSHIEKIRQLKERLAELRNETYEQETLWDKIKNKADDVWPVLDIIRVWGGNFVDLMTDVVDSYAAMDQEMANVRKFTGLTEEQVAALNEEFKKMDTRTSREELNKLAQEAGRLGKSSTEEVIGFVRAANQINVALDDLGEGATLTLSKLTGVFGDEKIYGTEQSLLKVGSVINELSQNCSASAPFLADFASRMGGVGAQAKMTIPQIMAFGAVLDTNGQRVEASATAVSQVIVHMMQEPAKYAKVAGLDVKKFSDMLKTDVNGALILFLETLQKAGGMDSLSPMFKDMGENGARAIEALSTLAKHIGDVKAQQAAANAAFAEGTSITQEYEVQNTTLEASLEKARKGLEELKIELGQYLAPLMGHFLTAASAAAKALNVLVGFIVENKASIIILASAVAVYTAALKINAIYINFAAVQTKVLTAAQTAWAATTKACSGIIAVWRLGVAAATNAVQYFTNGMRVSYEMQQRWKAAMAGMKFASWTGLLITLAAAVALYTKRVVSQRKAIEEARKKAEEYRKELSDLSADTAEFAKEETTRLKKLYDAATDQKKSTDERRKAVEALQKLYPDYFKNISAEVIQAGLAKSAYDKLTESILASARARAAEKKVEENQAKFIDLEEEHKQLKKDRDEKLKAYEDMRKAAEEAQKSAGSSPMQGSSQFGGTNSASMHIANQQALEKIRKEFEEANDKLISNARDRKVVTETTNSLIRQYGLAAKAAKEATEDSPEETAQPTGYTSQVQAEKERKKAEAEARRAAVKQRKEFKAEQDKIKGDRDKSIADAMALRAMGEIDYREYTERKFMADKEYYDKSIELFKTWSIQEDDECKALERKREEFLNKSNEQRVALNKEAIQRIAAAEERDLKARFAEKRNTTLADEMKLQDDLLKIRANALEDQQKLYDKGSKEWEDYQHQIDDLYAADQESKRKALLAKVSEFEKEFNKMTLKQKYDMEKAALEELFTRKMIKEEEYQDWLAKLDKKYQEEKEQSLPGQKPENNTTKAAAVNKKFDKDKSELDKAKADGMIDDEEYRTRLARIEAEQRKALLSPLAECKSEWVSMLTVMSESWAEFAEALKDPDGSPFEAMSNAIQATAAVATAVMQTVTAFQEAEFEIQSKAVEKRYDAEIEAAEGNSYKVKKLEKQREKELAKLKAEQSKKSFAMQVIATIAQTAANAVQAYSAGLAIGGPAGLIMAPIAAALAVAQGAVQIALIKKQQQAAAAQGYSKGGFTKKGAVDEPAGIVHAGEWVASQKLLASPVARPMIEALDYAQRTNTIGTLRREDVSRSIRANDTLSRAAESDGTSAIVAAAVAQNAEAMAALTERLREPIGAMVTVTGDYGINQGLEKYDALMKNKSPKSRR